MNLSDFINRYNGKFVDFDGYYGAQCVDLAQFYARELGAPRFWGNAKDIAGQTGGWWTWVPYTGVNTPPAGSVVIWDGRVGGGAGHIAIGLPGSTRAGFKSLDQNWPTNSGVAVRDHNYYAVAGWLVPKVTVSTGGTPLPWSDSQYFPYAENDAETLYQYDIGRKPSRDEARSRLGLPWSETFGAIVYSDEAWAARKEFVKDGFNGILFRPPSEQELSTRIRELADRKYTPQQFIDELINSPERKAKEKAIASAGVDVGTIEANFIAKIVANIGSFLNGLKSK